MNASPPAAGLMENDVTCRHHDALPRYLQLLLSISTLAVVQGGLIGGLMTAG